MEQPEPPEEQPTAAAEPAAADPLENFAVNLARQQAAERGEEEDEGVDEAFIARALAESRRMRQETGKSNQKRAANMAAVADRHGAGGLSAIQAAMQEHAARCSARSSSARPALTARRSRLLRRRSDGSVYGYPIIS